MAIFMACHACHARTQPLPLLSRAILLPNPTYIAPAGVISTFDSGSTHLISSHSRSSKGDIERMAMEHMMDRDLALRIAP